MSDELREQLHQIAVQIAERCARELPKHPLYDPKTEIYDSAVMAATAGLIYAYNAYGPNARREHN